jgi:hypothetical protein
VNKDSSAKSFGKKELLSAQKVYILATLADFDQYYLRVSNQGMRLTAELLLYFVFHQLYLVSALGGYSLFAN